MDSPFDVLGAAGELGFEDDEHRENFTKFNFVKEINKAGKKMRKGFGQFKDLIEDFIDALKDLFMEMIPEGLELAWKVILKNLSAAFRRTTQWSQETKRFLIIVYMYYLLLFTVIPLLIQTLVRALLAAVFGVSV